jgi:hypothetical protein
MSTESIHQTLYIKPFYNSPNYLRTTKEEFSIKGTLPVAKDDEWNTESKIVRIAKQIFYIIFFPIALCQLTHRLIGKLFIHASSPFILKKMYNYNSTAYSLRTSLELEEDWKYKRKTIRVNGTNIDVMLMGKRSTLQNRRWVLVSGGNGEFFETMLTERHGLQQFISNINGNAILFNYPGVGASGGLPHKQGMINTMKAILDCLEDEKGIGAKEIIPYGYSFIGAGVQAEALNKHPVKKGISYLAIKDRASSSISAATPLRLFMKLFGWDFATANCSKRLHIPEIILQTATVERYERLQDSSKIIYDDILREKATLAKVLLDDPSCNKENKLFLGIYELHDIPLRHGGALAAIVNDLLAPRPNV